MAWLLLTATAVLAVLVLVLALQVRRLDARVARLAGVERPQVVRRTPS